MPSPCPPAGELNKRESGGSPERSGRSGGDAGRRHALIIACDTYDDERFSALRAPRQDVDALTRVFADPAIGNFTVRPLINRPVQEVNNALADFLQERSAGDLAVVYFSCHGIKDDSGRLYLAAKDTRLDRLRTSGIRASLLHEEMDDSRARQIVLFLDCCFSGAFSREMAPRASERLDVAEQLAGRGRVVITASSSTEYAFEDGQRVDQNPAPSFFTEALVEGLETGSADRDGDGQITAEELYFYVYDRVRERTSKQTPTRSTQAGQGDIYLARRMRLLPPELQHVEFATDPWEVLGGVAELASHATYSSMGLGTAARQALERLAEHPNDEVAGIARAALAGDHPPKEHRPESGASHASLPQALNQWFESDPTWFRRAVFYQVDVRAFSDGNADGSGDFRGLTEKLDYLQWLGVDCIWLLPMFASPLRDGGYDIANYEAIHPDYGTIDDVRDFIEAAHKRGIRVIADIVINHTSSDHMWFQESRKGGEGNPYADWYVWSDTDERYQDARIIFTDTEVSNWTWDPVRGAYYWHRFFSHQPDLNYDNPAVHDAMLNTLRFWLDLGLSGFRLVAAPFLVERDGTTGEDLPESVAIVSKLARQVRESHPECVIIVDAQRWDEAATAYAAAGNDVLLRHMSFAPKFFVALRREIRGDMLKMLRRPPALRRASFAFFLRDHDELALSAVGADERDYLYAEYAKDPRARINVGIRRRLAPLIDSGRDELELAFAVLFALPGSPVMYYGDEIGMGDNYLLGDRDGVRTPMHWTPDRNAGFSKCEFPQLYLPPLMDTVYGYQAVNVEAQLRLPNSPLHWLRRFIALRQQYPVLAEGDLLPLYPSNPRVLAFARVWEDDVVLIAANMARSAQVVDLDLSPWEQRDPEELFGRTKFPTIGGRPYRLTFAPRGFLYLRLLERGPDRLS